jgi:exodeoxyribonuclease VII small subunit
MATNQAASSGAGPAQAVLPPANHPDRRGWFALKYRAKLQIDTMQKKSAPEQGAQQPASFEQAMAELEQLVARMEAGELPLEASVAAYQRGSELVKYCTAQLDKVDGQVKILEGELLKPFAAAADAAIEADE